MKWKFWKKVPKPHDLATTLFVRATKIPEGDQQRYTAKQQKFELLVYRLYLFDYSLWMREKESSNIQQVRRLFNAELEKFLYTLPSDVAGSVIERVAAYARAANVIDHNSPAFHLGTQFVASWSPSSQKYYDVHEVLNATSIYTKVTESVWDSLQEFGYLNELPKRAMFKPTLKNSVREPGKAIADRQPRQTQVPMPFGPQVSPSTQDNVDKGRLPNDGVQLSTYGSKVMRFTPNSDFGSLIRATVRVIRQDLMPEEMIVAERWVVRITGIPIKNGVWKPEHETVFVNGFERLLWEADSLGNQIGGQHSAEMHRWYREKYPTITESPFNVPVDHVMREMYRRMLGAWQQPGADTSSSNKPPIEVQPLAPIIKQQVLPRPSPKVETEFELLLKRGKYHRENDFRNIGEWERRMVSEFGQKVLEVLPRVWDDIAKKP